MNLHEYQAKALLESFQILIPSGVCIQEATPENLATVKGTFKNHAQVAVKAQIHAGGRGKGHFKENGKAGVQLVSGDCLEEAITSMLHNTLVTKQTGEEGQKVNAVYVTEVFHYTKAFYLSICIDRAHQCPVVIASRQGGVDIETVAATHPDQIIRIPINPSIGLCHFQGRAIANCFQLTGSAYTHCIQTILNLYKAFVALDATLIEINPLVLSDQQQIVALDSKVQIDDNALFRTSISPSLVPIQSPTQTSTKEVPSSIIRLDGNIACLSNGAGLCMATLDLLHQLGGQASCFIDLGDSASEQKIDSILDLVLTDSQSKGVLINVFGGTFPCDILAQRLIQKIQQHRPTKSIQVRLEGNKSEEARELLKTAPVPFTDDLQQAIQNLLRSVSL